MAMNDKAVVEKRFDEILRRMLQSKPLLRSRISSKIEARRKVGRARKLHIFFESRV